MAGRIPETVLDDILSRVDIVEVISSYLPLKRAGRNFKAPCPFHHEKTPSFLVSPDRQIYHCFGCGESGNAFRFLMRFERLDFLEAVRTLAKKVGVALPESAASDPQATSLSTQIYKINELAAGWYAEKLRGPQGKAAAEYLARRGISPETQRQFQVGFAPDAWDGLLSFLRAKQVPLSLLEKAGLVVPKDSGGYYDRFRNRVIFPVLDIKGRVVGFGARVLDASLPKYINSPETPVYTKGRHLFGMNCAKDAVRENDRVVVVEGYLDCIMPYQAGFKHIVASLGTALTLEQVRMIKRYTHNVVMLYDADLAGQAAMLRSLDIFVEEGVEVRMASLPDGMDPDVFVRKEGLEGFKEKVSRAQSLFDFKLGMLKKRHDPRLTEGKARIASEMLDTIVKFKHAVLRSEYVHKLADELQVAEEALLQELNGKAAGQASKAISLKMPQQASSSPMHPTERLLVSLMLEESELVHRIKASLVPDDFQDEKISRIVELLFDLAEQGKQVDPRSLVNYLDDESSLKMICESAFMIESSAEHKEKVVEDCIGRLKDQRIKVKKQLLHDAIKAAQASGDEDKLQRLVSEFGELLKAGK